MSASDLNRKSKTVEEQNKDVDIDLSFYLCESLAEAVAKAEAEQEQEFETSVAETDKDDDLEELLQTTAKTFSEKLVSLVEEKNITVSLLCRRSDIERRHFSKMKHNRNY